MSGSENLRGIDPLNNEDVVGAVIDDLDALAERVEKLERQGSRDLKSGSSVADQVVPPASPAAPADDEALVGAVRGVLIHSTVEYYSTDRAARAVVAELRRLGRLR